MFVGLIDFAVEKNTLNLNFVGIRIPWVEVTQRSCSMHLQWLGTTGLLSPSQ